MIKAIIMMLIISSVMTIKAQENWSSIPLEDFGYSCRLQYQKKDDTLKLKNAYPYKVFIKYSVVNSGTIIASWNKRALDSGEVLNIIGVNASFRAGSHNYWKTPPDYPFLAISTIKDESGEDLRGTVIDATKIDPVKYSSVFDTVNWSPCGIEFTMGNSYVLSLDIHTSNFFELKPQVEFNPTFSLINFDPAVNFYLYDSRDCFFRVDETHLIKIPKLQIYCGLGITFPVNGNNSTVGFLLDYGLRYNINEILSLVGQIGAEAKGNPFRPAFNGGLGFSLYIL
jgi:hypothetical protein